MRACFLEQNICEQGFGVAPLQTPAMLVDGETGKPIAPDANRPVGQNVPFRSNRPSPVNLNSL